MVSDHELVSIEVDPPVLPAEVEAQARGAAREKALSTNTDRALLLTACAVEIERYAELLFWSGSGQARSSTALVIVQNRGFSVPYCPLYPRTVLQALTSVRLWRDDAQDWTTLTSGNGYRTAPGSRIRVNTAGQYEIVASLMAPTTAPPSAIEALARLWAYRETLRPGDLTDVGGEQQVLAGAMMKSGAAEVLRGVRWRVTV